MAFTAWGGVHPVPTGVAGAIGGAIGGAIDGGIDGADVAGGDVIIFVGANGVAWYLAGVDAGAIVTTAAGFAAATAAIARGFVNGMTLGCDAGDAGDAGAGDAGRSPLEDLDDDRTGVTNDGISPCLRSPSGNRGARASSCVAASSKRDAFGMARRAREESRRLVELMNEATCSARGPPSRSARSSA